MELPFPNAIPVLKVYEIIYIWAHCAFYVRNSPFVIWIWKTYITNVVSFWFLHHFTLKIYVTYLHYLGLTAWSSITYPASWAIRTVILSAWSIMTHFIFPLNTLSTCDRTLCSVRMPSMGFHCREILVSIIT